MLRSNLPGAVGQLRHRLAWRQADLAAHAGVSREAISRIERGGVRGVTIASIEKVVAALGARLDVIVRWEGAELERLTDAVHARIQDDIAAQLTVLGWLTRVEVSFNHYGDRGRVDVLAFHPVHRLLLVVEVKSALGDLQETLGKLDVKVRVARGAAAELGWTEDAATIPTLVLRDTRAARRVVAAHPALFARFAIRGRQALAWVRAPRSAQPTAVPPLAVPPRAVPSGLLWFANVPDSHGLSGNRDRRVRTVKSDD